MNENGNWKICILPGQEPVLKQAALVPADLFSDPRIHVWRNLPERQNCYLDVGELRLHIKRYLPPHGAEAAAEAKAVSLLTQAGIPTVPLVAWGTDSAGRGFLVTEHLRNFVPADSPTALKLNPERTDQAVADLAAKLHGSGLHHRDLYLCHFMINPEGQARLIDPGRVAQLPIPPFHFRWIIKDMAQLCYSTRDTGLGYQQQKRILQRYYQQTTPMRRLMLKLLLPLKIAAIARHDRRLRRRRPERRISID